MCTGGGRVHLAPIWLIGTMCLRKATIFKEHRKFKEIQGNSKEIQRKFNGLVCNCYQNQ